MKIIYDGSSNTTKFWDENDLQPWCWLLESN